MGFFRRKLGQLLRSRVAGPDADAKAEAIWGTKGPRWHQPGDVIWHINGDGAMYTGGIRSLLLQSLHPSAMAGVAAHSGYKSDPWGRLQRTSEFIAMTTYGPIDAGEAIIAKVRTIHERVRGKNDRGEPYRASDPHLLAWVHVAETESFLTAFQNYGDRKLTQAEADEYVASAALVGEKLGAINLPRTEASLRASLENFREELRLTDAAKEAADFILKNPPVPGLARYGYLMLAAGAIVTLPRWAREELGLAWPRILDPVFRGIGWTATAAVRWGSVIPPYRTPHAHAPPRMLSSITDFVSSKATVRRHSGRSSEYPPGWTPRAKLVRHVRVDSLDHETRKGISDTAGDPVSARCCDDGNPRFRPG